MALNEILLYTNGTIIALAIIVRSGMNVDGTGWLERFLKSTIVFFKMLAYSPKQQQEQSSVAKEPEMKDLVAKFKKSGLMRPHPVGKVIIKYYHPSSTSYAEDFLHIGGKHGFNLRRNTKDEAKDQHRTAGS